MSTPPAGVPSLVLTGDETGSVTLPAPGPHLLGRDPAAAVVLSHSTVSTRHAEVAHNGQAWLIRDAGSLNGTTVNGARVTAPRRLTAGDVVTLGQARLTVAAGAAGTPPAPSRPAPPPTRMHATQPFVMDESDRRVLDLPTAQHAVTIGRAAENTVTLDDHSVSRFHARLEMRADGLWVTDLDSSNGTFLNGERIAGAHVAPTDTLRIGKTVFTLDGAGSSIAAARPAPMMEARGLGLRGRGGVVLLRDVSLTIPVGELIAILGPAGAGKSTLLNALSGVTRPDAGHVTVSGEPLEAMYAEVARVPQDDIVHRDLTPREALEYAAGLRLPPDHTRKEVREVVDRLLGELDLHSCADRPITMASGGQRKRVGVGTEMVGQPRLLFLDEPGAGLDAAHDRDLMAMCRRLADDGRAVVLTTHNTWHIGMCDRLLLVGRGGVLRYDGPPDGALEAFGAPSLTEVYDHLDTPTDEVAPPAAPDDAAPAPLASAAAARRQLSGPHVRTLIRRNATLAIRDAKSLLISLLGAPLLALLAVLLFRSDALTPEGAPAAKSVNMLLALALVATWMGAFAGLRAFVAELPSWRREYSLGVAAASNLAAKAVVLGALVVVQGLLIAGAFFVVMRPQLAGDLKVGIAVTLVLAGLAGLAAGLLISASSRNEARAVSLVLPYVVLQFFFAGVVVPISEMGALGVAAWVVSSRWAVAGLGSLAQLVPTAQHRVAAQQAEHGGGVVSPDTQFLDRYGTDFFTVPSPVFVGALVVLTVAAAWLTHKALIRSART